MSIINRSFLTFITNPIPLLNGFEQYWQYLEKDVQTLLSATLLSHIFEGGGDDTRTFLLFRHENKYLLLNIWEGTCDGCNRQKLPYNSFIEDALDKCYVSTNINEVEQYYLKCLRDLERDTEYRTKEDLYRIHPS